MMDDGSSVSSGGSSIGSSRAADKELEAFPPRTRAEASWAGAKTLQLKSDVGSLINELLLDGVISNATDAARSRLFNVLKKNVKDKMPSFQQAMDFVLREGKAKIKEYPACPNDCYVFPKVKEEWENPADLLALRCPICTVLLYSPQKRAFKKVSGAHYVTIVSM